jgi:hypothetical protein
MKLLVTPKVFRLTCQQDLTLALFAASIHQGLWDKENKATSAPDTRQSKKAINLFRKTKH